MMSRISVTLNPYEYSYVMHLRNIPLYSGVSAFEGLEIKEILWGAVEFSVDKAQANKASYASLVNQFLRKANLPPIPEDTEIDDFRFRIIEKEFEGQAVSVERITEGTYENFLFNMNLTTEDRKKLDKLIGWISKDARGLKAISYPQFFRECLHFVIDRPKRLVEFSSVIYVGVILNFAPFYALRIYTNADLVDEEHKNTPQLKKLKNVYDKFKKWLIQNPMPWEEKTLRRAFNTFIIELGSLPSFFVGFLAMRQFITNSYMDIPSIVLNTLYFPQKTLYGTSYKNDVSEFFKYTDFFLSKLCE